MTDTQTAEPVSVTGTLPLYRDAQVIQAERHADVAIRTGGEGFDFAAKAPLVPITVDEFERAALDYPIVLVGPERIAFAVMGLSADRNLFVRTDGTFRPGAYIPAYLRRYPFVFAQTSDSEHRLLCLDAASERVVERGTDGAEPLFSDGVPTDLTRQAVAFCSAFEQAERRTRSFAELLDTLELLDPREAHWNPPGSENDNPPQLLVTYAAPSRERMERLSAESLGRLHDASALAPLYALAFSAANWDVLSMLQNQEASDIASV